MAQLRDTVVSGSLRATDSLLTTTVQAKILNIPTASNGTTYGPGTSGHIIFSNGSSAYWGATTGITSLGTVTTGTWSATTIAVNKGGTGNTSWTQWGVLYASDTTTLTNTSAGTSGYLLQGNGSAAPSWIQATAENVASTVVKRSSGNVIKASNFYGQLYYNYAPTGNNTSATVQHSFINLSADDKIIANLSVNESVSSGTTTLWECQLQLGAPIEQTPPRDGRLLICSSTPDSSSRTLISLYDHAQSVGGITEYASSTAAGKTQLSLGNSTASGTLGNAQGQIRLYNNSTTYSTITAQYGVLSAIHATNNQKYIEISDYTKGTFVGNLYGNAATATHLSSTSDSSKFYRGDKTWSNALTGGLELGGNLSFTNSGTAFRGIHYGTMGDNDQWRIGGAATGSNAGYMEIATADDGTEPIYVRQYTGVFSTLKRTLTLLDSDGNTAIPGRLYKSYGRLELSGKISSRPQGSTQTSTITQPGGANPVELISYASTGNDFGLVHISNDECYVCNSADSGYAFAVFDTDKTVDFSTAANASFYVKPSQEGAVFKGTVTATNFDGSADKVDDWHRDDIRKGCLSFTRNINSANPTNLNNLNDGMAYNYGSGAYWQHAPSSPTYGSCIALTSGGDKTLGGQFYWDINHNSSSSTRSLWFRAANDLGWQDDWKQLVWNSGSWGISVTGSSGSCTGNAATASKITNLTTADAASNTDTWRRIWITYTDLVTGRPAYTDSFVYQTSTGICKSPRFYASNGNGFQVSTNNVTGKLYEYSSTTVGVNSNKNLYLIAGGTTSSSYSIGLFANGTGGIGISCYNYNGTNYCIIQGYSFKTLSSRLAKTNIQTLTDIDAKKILQLRPVSFDWKESFGGIKGEIGLIAEEVEPIIPYLVHTPKDYDPSKFNPSKGAMQPLKSLDYVKVVPYLIKLAQLQQREIDQLRNELNLLKSNI